MVPQKYILIACLVLFTACQKGRTYFPKDLEPQDIEIVRFDRVLMNVHTGDAQSTKEDIHALYDEYPVFMPLWVEDILGIPAADTGFLAQALPAFLNDTVYGFQQTNAKEQEDFADVRDIEKALEKAFARIAATSVAGILIHGALYFYLMNRGRCFCDKEIWKEALL